MKELAVIFADSLKCIPQDPVYHPEGDVLIHTKLVRKYIPQAIKYINDLKAVEPFAHILKNINFIISPLEDKILRLSAWLHDIGKISATTIDEDNGRIRSIGHENPEHFLQHINKLKPIAPPDIVKLYSENEELISFIIRHHMDISKGGFPKYFVAKYMKEGSFLDLDKIKLLLIIMYADKMGRKPQSLESILKNDKALLAAKERNTKNNNVVKPQVKTESEFRKMLQKRGLNPSKIEEIVKSKFQ